jgi:putative ABC transport system ATP-binding protein
MTELRVSELTIEYNRSGYVVRPIDGLDAQASDGELVLLLGPSGCGKTTLLSCMAGLLTPARGTIRVGSTEVTELDGSPLTEFRRRSVGIVFQAFNLVASLTVRENVMAPLRLAGTPRRAARHRAEELLELVALGNRMDHRPDELSGGQQQRVAIARALVHDPPLILADEPTAHLDYVQVEEILRLLREIASPGRLVVVATHDDRFRPLADRVFDLTPQAPAEDEPAQALTLAAGELLFRQGDRSDLVYVIERGQVEAFGERADGSEELRAIYGEGEYFGELGPLLSIPRTASVRATETTVLTSYGPQAFRAWQATRANGGSRTSRSPELSPDGAPEAVEAT